MLLHCGVSDLLLFPEPYDHFANAFPKLHGIDWLEYIIEHSVLQSSAGIFEIAVSAKYNHFRAVGPAAYPLQQFDTVHARHGDIG
ncbi:hypothetical protein D3C77_667880 [compost metagenome]